MVRARGLAQCYASEMQSRWLDNYVGLGGSLDFQPKISSDLSEAQVDQKGRLRIRQ